MNHSIGVYEQLKKTKTVKDKEQELLKEGMIKLIQEYPGDLKDIVVVFVRKDFEVDVYWKSSYKDFRKILATVDRGITL